MQIEDGGLSEEAAKARLLADGPNELPSAKPRSAFFIALEVVREPMFLLLGACGSIYFLLGEVRDAMMLMGFVVVIISITFFQERKTERTLEALRDLSSPRALVVRDGVPRRIPGREVVRGDVFLLGEGDRVPADAEIVSCVNLMCDESLLTGESAPVRKDAAEGSEEAPRPGGDGLPWIFSGTLVVNGQGTARAVATGQATEMGRIGRALKSIERETSPLWTETRRVVRLFTVVGLSLFAFVVAAYGVLRGAWVDGLLAGIAMAMSILPEEVPVILTVFLALGAWRISHKKVLARSIPAVETLGAVTVLCVDKTGTLTQNKMTVARLYADGEFFDVEKRAGAGLPEKFHELVEYGVLAGKKEPFDPMEKAFLQLGGTRLEGTPHLHERRVLVREYPISRRLLAFTNVWRKSADGGHVIATKGAPEAVADLCHLGAAGVAEVKRRAEEMARDGLRVIAVAAADEPPGFNGAPEQLPAGHHDFEMRFLGLAGFSDPVRPNVAESVRECYAAGIRIIMITGDYPATAKSVADQIGLSYAGGVVTGEELEGMGGDELRTRIRTANIFGRVAPEQKLRIVEALKENGEIAAMTGDGVNDAPALKAAHIGVAMGERGTDVAREAAGLVLTNDDFSSIVAAIRQGRRMFDNLRKAMAYTLAIHVPIAGMSLAPLFFGWPPIFLPMHIAFLELIIDPACSIVFEVEGEEADVMSRPPRRNDAPLFGRALVLPGLLLGLSVFAIVFAVFAVAMHRGQGAEDARALTFTTLIVSNVALILTNRSWTHGVAESIKRPNPAFWWLLGGAFVFLTLVLYAPPLRAAFRFSFLHPVDLLISLLAGLAAVLWFELLKKRGRVG
ncbi:MAG: cation-translocating P-type ATPase [Nitrospinae bacterium]|nr:cation-translocating P-type ATPase [Nitrospinota bacterium]